MPPRIRPSKLPLLLPGHAFEVLTSGNTAWLVRAPDNIPGPHIAPVPHIDDPELPTEDSDPLPDWTKENSEVVRAHWTAFTTKAEAMEYFRRQYGHIYQDLSTAKWWAARVPKRKVP